MVRYKNTFLYPTITISNQHVGDSVNCECEMLPVVRMQKQSVSSLHFRAGYYHDNNCFLFFNLSQLSDPSRSVTGKACFFPFRLGRAFLWRFLLLIFGWRIAPHSDWPMNPKKRLVKDRQVETSIESHCEFMMKNQSTTMQCFVVHLKTA